MRLAFACRASLPRLAWGAVIEKGPGDATLYHGEQIEVREDGFFEGAWNGPVNPASALTASVVCGSGGAFDGYVLRFWAGTDNIFPIYSIRRNGALLVSNSAIFVQVLAGEEPDPAYPFYYDDFVRIARRGFNTRGSLRTASGNRLRLHFGHIMTVDRHLNNWFSRHPVCAPFSGYESYYRLLSSSVEQVLENASSGQRRCPYTALASCTRGYDANACAAIAARAGCEEAVTFTTPEEDGGMSDSGEEIARALKLRCVTGSKRDFRSAEDLSEFCITPHSIYPTYRVFESVLPGRILLMGSNGGVVWGMNRSLAFDDNCMSWLRYVAGYGLLEFRLRLGFLAFAPARIGSVYNRQLHRISHSEEMRPWRLSGNYDRPIARRIVEEAGVDRGAFGMRKMASSQVRFDGPAMQQSSTGLAYRRFMEERARKVGPLVGRYWRYCYRWRLFILRNFSRPDRRVGRYTPFRRMFSFLMGRPAFYEWYFLFTHQFSFDALMDRYTVYEAPQPAARGDEARAEQAGRSARSGTAL